MPVWVACQPEAAAVSGRSEWVAWVAAACRAWVPLVAVCPPSVPAQGVLARVGRGRRSVGPAAPENMAPHWWVAKEVVGAGPRVSGQAPVGAEPVRVDAAPA